jgi:very-short-patch-repair endonuclease
MSFLPPEILRWTATHHGTVTVEVLRKHGVTETKLRRLVSAGVLERILDGVYRFTGAPQDELARCVAASYRPSGLIVAGPTAGRLWQARRIRRDGFVDVLAPPASHPARASWLRPYRTALISPADIVDRDDGIRVTSPPRTAADLARHLPMEDVLSIVDQFEQRGLCTAATMRAVALPLATPGRPWARRFVEMLDGRLGGGVPESHWESRVVGGLLGRGLTDLRPQRWLDVPGWGRIRLDLAIDRLRWGLEIDGHPEHFTESGGARDRNRDLACDGIGWRVSRVASMTLAEDFEGALDRIVLAVRRRERELGGWLG